MVDNLITLYESNEKLFQTNGLGNLSEASKCEVTEELNGAFELELEYPITGIHYDEIQLRRIIYTRTNLSSNKQAFRIYAISKPIGGIVTVNAEHISYDLSNYIANPFDAENADTAIGNMQIANCILPSGSSDIFEIHSSIHQEKEMKVKAPTSIRSLISGNNDSFLNVYGGDVSYTYNGFNVNLIPRRGLSWDDPYSKKVTIEYGKNLTDIKQDENCSNVYTHLLPYFYYYNETTTTTDEQTEETVVEERVVYTPGNLIPITNLMDWEAYLQAIHAEYPLFDWEVDEYGRYYVSDVKYMEDYGMWQFSDEDVDVALSVGMRKDLNDSTSGVKFQLYDSNDVLKAETSYFDETWRDNAINAKACKIKMTYTTRGHANFKWMFISRNTQVKVLPLDVSSSWNNKNAWSKQFPSVDEVNEIGVQYLADNDLKTPKIDISVSFQMLSQTLEYADLSRLETVDLGDDVKIIFTQMGISAVSRCVKTVYDVITGKYTSVELGEGKSDFAYHMVESQKSTQTEIIENTDFLTDRLNYAGQMVTGNVGGYVIMRDSDGDELPDEILIMDEPNLEDALNVWRWNKSGMAHATRLHAGDPLEYNVAITQAGEIDARFITTGTMTADRILGGTLAVGGSNRNGLIQVKDTNNRVILEIDHLGLYFRYYDSQNIGHWLPTQITSKGIKAGSVDAEDITGTTISGKTITAGGNNDADGKFLVKNSSGDVIVTIDHNGITFAEGYDLQISWSQLPSDVANESDIPSDSHITQITKNTVTTEFVNALNVHAGSVDAEDINAGTINGMTITGTNISGSNISGSVIQSADTNTGYSTTIQNGFISTSFMNLLGSVLASTGASIGSQRVTPQGGVIDAGSLYFYDGYIYDTGGFTASGTITGDEIRSLTSTTTSTNQPLSFTAGDVPGLIRKYVASSSSIRYKHDFKTKFNNDLDPHGILNIKIIQFKYKTDFLNDPEDKLYDKDVIGFIAEDVYKKYKVASDYYYDKKREKDIITGWSPYFMIPPMLYLIQEQHEEIENLKQEVSELKSQMNEILELLKNKK